MKRSEINEILGHTRQFFSMHDVHLPPLPASRLAAGSSLTPMPGKKCSICGSAGM